MRSSGVAVQNTLNPEGIIAFQQSEMSVRDLDHSGKVTLYRTPHPRT